MTIVPLRVRIQKGQSAPRPKAARRASRSQSSPGGPRTSRRCHEVLQLSSVAGGVDARSRRCARQDEGVDASPSDCFAAAAGGSAYAHQHQAVVRRSDRRAGPNGSNPRYSCPWARRGWSCHSYDRFPTARTRGLDPNPPVRLLQSSPTLGPTSYWLCVYEAAVRGHLERAKKVRSSDADR
jgi:hypothetical protein